MDELYISLTAKQIAEIGGFPITNALLTSWVVMAILIIVGVLIGGNLQKIPGRVQTFFETIFDYLIGYMEEVLESRGLAMRLFPLVTTLFFFILLGNWLGLFPGIGSIGVVQEVYGQEQFVSLFHPVSTDLNVTLALAIIAFLTIEVVGVLIIGFLKYAGKFVNVRSVIGFLVGIIELFSELARLISFSFRLFGNMFAGKTLLLVAMFFVPYLLPLPILLFEVFVGFIQAAIFALLTLFFVKIAISEAH